MPPKKKAPEVAGPSASNPPPWSKRVVGTAPAAERASPSQLMVPRRPNMHRAPLRRHGTSSVLALTVPYARWTQIELADPRVLKASIHTNVLVQAWRDCLARVLLLLT